MSLDTKLYNLVKKKCLLTRRVSDQKLNSSTENAPHERVAHCYQAQNNNYTLPEEDELWTHPNQHRYPLPILGGELARKTLMDWPNHAWPSFPVQEVPRESCESI